MINGYLLEKRSQTAKHNQRLQKKAEQQEKDHNKQNEKLREIFDKRIERIIEHRKHTPLEPIQNFVLNETFFREMNNTQYKMSTTNGTVNSFLKRTFNCSKKAQVEASMEKNRILLPEYTESKPVDFRPRRVNREIQPSLRFKNEHDFRITLCNTRENSNDSRSNYNHLNRSMDTTGYNQKAKSDSSKIRYGPVGHIRRLSTGTQCTVDFPNTSTTLTRKTRTDLDSIPIKSILTRTIHLPRSKVEFTKKKCGGMNISDVDDEMLYGEDISFEHIVAQNSPKNLTTLRNAKEVLKAAKLIK